MIHAESRVRVGRPGSDHVSTCRRRIRTEATIVGRWCGRTLHGRTGGRFIDVSTGDRYMQKVGLDGRPRSDHVSTCRRRIHTEAAGMGSHPFHSHRMHKKLQVSKSGRAAENWGFQRDMAGYYLNSSVVFKFWVANQTIVMAKKKRRKKNYP